MKMSFPSVTKKLEINESQWKSCIILIWQLFSPWKFPRPLQSLISEDDIPLYRGWKSDIKRSRGLPQTEGGMSREKLG